MNGRGEGTGDRGQRTASPVVSPMDADRPSNAAVIRVSERLRGSRLQAAMQSILRGLCPAPGGLSPVPCSLSPLPPRPRSAP
jgi:hypothetical protein